MQADKSESHADLLDLPKHHRCVAFAEFGKLYGPLTFLKAISKPLLVINTFEVAQDLLDKRGHIYSDRPHLHFAGDIVGMSSSVCILNEFTEIVFVLCRLR